MLRNLSIGLSLSAFAAPVLACQPPVPSAEFTDAEVDREAAQLIQQSDAIIDATVVELLDGEVMLQALRVWKGPNLRHWRVTDVHCGTAFPLPGESVRVLLRRDGSRNWDPVDPSLGGRLVYPVRMERAIDRLLGSQRPKDFVFIHDAVPPPSPEAG